MGGGWRSVQGLSEEVQMALKRPLGEIRRSKVIPMRSQMEMSNTLSETAGKAILTVRGKEFD